MENKKSGSERATIIVCFFVWGFVMVDRFALHYLAPYVKGDLEISNTQFGLILSAFAVTWAIAGWFGSFLADMTGSKKKGVLLAIVCFTICSAATGFMQTYVLLFAVRTIMGCFEGPMLPMLQSFIFAESSPKRRGFNMGIVQTTAVGILSTVLGPIVLVALAEYFGWRQTFFFTAIPGILLFIIVWRYLREPQVGGAKPPVPVQSDEKPHAPEKVRVVDIFKHRNVVISIISAPFIMGWYELVLSFTPLYLVEEKGMNNTEMSFMISALGIGAVCFGMIVPAISDRIGRKPSMHIFTLVAILAPLGILLVPKEAFALMFVICIIGWAGTGVFPIYQSAITSESSPQKFLSTSIATIQMVGGIFGVAVGSTLSGYLGDRYGLYAVEILCCIYMAVAFVLSLFYKETAPLVLARRAEKQGESA
ncbi:MAG: MFS transporter [Clostridiales Family XIII bacterium]|jgi:predicted MFS family arabinose efflux permease|nr:MFS transporter [Clostridiales Family XIII bacterium]